MTRAAVGRASQRAHWRSSRTGTTVSRRSRACSTPRTTRSSASVSGGFWRWPTSKSMQPRPNPESSTWVLSFDVDICPIVPRTILVFSRISPPFRRWRSRACTLRPCTVFSDRFFKLWPVGEIIPRRKDGDGGNNLGQPRTSLLHRVPPRPYGESRFSTLGSGMSA